ncbi:serine/threonine-protein kinase-like protein At3g51990 [Cucurbita maxima]|uniref:Serine/threonine-protein kinase-like protein At3g51990 n=1 Tax=Cucurbita maxima TaxID=3661 RepID=A0A6J1J547_CUCMA|nr:serine/threonine-protein kinase-like protein At3g51990 [Cucurbita maxima]
MGYLSCRAESSISTSNSLTPSSSRNSSQKSEKPIKIQQFDYSDLEAATNGFSDQKLLGKGSHGYVYKAVLGGRLVAVKKPSRAQILAPSRPVSLSSSMASYEIANEVDNEIEILSKIQSPGLVNLVGFTNDSRDRLLVVEFMSNGTLYDVIHSGTRPLYWGRRIRLALQTAKAIETLHASNPPVIHRDIKSANVLIDRNYNARLGDFGLAIQGHADDYRLRSTPPAGTMGYLDPCYVTPDNLSTKTDVFSFGILLLEIISGRKAIDVGYSPPSIVDWAVPLIKKGKLMAIYDPRIAPPKDPIVTKQLAVIAAKCVRSCRERRPSMKDVVVWLTGLSKLVPLHSWNGFNNPCLMVETVGRPVETRNSSSNLRSHSVEDGDLDIMSRRDIKNSRRVYSDLGISNNLMDLMACIEEESGFRNVANRVESHSRLSNRFFSSRFVSRKNHEFEGK